MYIGVGFFSEIDICCAMFKTVVCWTEDVKKHKTLLYLSVRVQTNVGKLLVLIVQHQ